MAAEPDAAIAKIEWSNDEYNDESELMNNCNDVINMNRLVIFMLLYRECGILWFRRV